MANWRRTSSLRSLFAALTIVAGGLALLVTVALVGGATILHWTITRTGSSVESVRLAQEAQIDMLLHSRVRDGLVRQSVEADLRRRLVNAQRYVATGAEGRVLAEATRNVEVYLEASEDPAVPAEELATRRDVAYGALESLAAVNLVQVREAQARAAGWGRLAQWVGIGIGATALIATAAILLWLRLRAFSPVFALAAAMDRFARGDREARAEEAGPTELRAMSRRFNEVAAAVSAQRQMQIAFLGGVAHDLRNPLQILKMSASVVRADAPLPPEPRLRQVLERIERQIVRLDRMVGDFLDISRIDSGGLELKLAEHDARDLVRNVMSLFEGISSDHARVVLLPDEPVPVVCDDLRMEQVMTNLVSNAFKYSPDGTSIVVAVERAGPEVVLRVSDQGSGIAPKDHEHIFEPFRRLGLSKGSVPGAGLGLFVVRRIVEAHGGRIAVESAPGAGATFRVFLPGS